MGFNSAFKGLNLKGAKNPVNICILGGRYFCQIWTHIGMW